MFIDTFEALCKQKGVTMNRACLEIGISRTSTAKWKNGSIPNGQTLSKIAEYFDVTTDFLLQKEKAPTESGKRSVSDEDIKFALFGGDGDITDAMFDEVKQFAAMVKLREDSKKKKE